MASQSCVNVESLHDKLEYSHTQSVNLLASEESNLRRTCCSASHGNIQS